ncbi:MAG: hypothetical protein QXJ27_00555 [Thermoplasmata archaeon]
MALENQKLLFFSAIFVVIVAVGVTVGKVAISAPSTSGVMSPAQLWKAIDQGKLQNQSFHQVEGVINRVDLANISGFQLGLVYFKGCDSPFIWGVSGESPYDYINTKVTVYVGVAYFGNMVQGLGKNGWVAIITSIVR